MTSDILRAMIQSSPLRAMELVSSLALGGNGREILLTVAGDLLAGTPMHMYPKEEQRLRAQLAKFLVSAVDLGNMI